MIRKMLHIYPSGENSLRSGTNIIIQLKVGQNSLDLLSVTKG